MSAELDIKIPQPPSIWRRLLPAWLRALIWVDEVSNYEAFLSYCQAADLKIAPVIQSVLQNFLRPWYKTRARNIFRDFSCLPASSDLKKGIQQRLDVSKHLIVLANPQAGHSRGMETEAQYWFSRERHGEVLIVITDGNFKNWDDQESEVGIRNGALPPTLRDKLQAEPLYIDLRHRRQDMLEHPNRSSVRKELTEDLKQVFLLFYPDRTWEQLKDQERVERRRKLALVVSSLAVLVLLGVSVLWQRAVANIRESVTASRASEDADPEISVLAASQAAAAAWPWGYSVRPEAENQLHRSILASHVRLTLSGHSGPVSSVAWSPDGKRLVTGSADGTTKLWDPETGGEVLTVSGQGRGVTSVAWSPDGSQLAIGNCDGTVRLWDTKSWKELGFLGSPTPCRQSYGVLSVAWSPDSRRLAVGLTVGYGAGTAYGSVEVWDARTRRKLLWLRHPTIIDSVAWSPDGKWLATGGGDNRDQPAPARIDTVKVWDAVSGREMRSLGGYKFAVESIAWSPDSTRLATGSSDKTARVWNADTGKELQTLRGHGDTVKSVAWSPEGTRLATGSTDHTVKIWDVAAGHELLTLYGHTNFVYGVAWRPDGRRIASGSEDDTVKIWNAEANKELLTLSGDTKNVMSVAWSPDGRRLATGGNDRNTESLRSSGAPAKVRIWDATTGNVLLGLSGHGDRVNGLAWSPTGERLATASVDRTARVWDAVSGRELFTLRGHGESVNGIAWSPEGNRLATGSDDHTAWVWDAGTGRELLILSGHSAAVTSVAWSPNGKQLATGSSDEKVKVWDAASGKELLSLSGHGGPVYGVAWSPDGRRLVTGSRDQTARVWDATTGRQLLPAMAQGDIVYSVAWGPHRKLLETGSGDHDLLAIGIGDHTAKVWDAETGKQLLTLGGHSDTVNSVAWSPDGNRLATGSWDGTVQLHAMDIHDLMTLARQRVTARPSEKGCKIYLHVDKCPTVPE